jgi:hypothetical protein
VKKQKPKQLKSKTSLRACVKKTLLRQSTFANKTPLQAPEEAIITFLAQQTAAGEKISRSQSGGVCAIKLSHYPFKQTTGIGHNSR